jgi:hypothetical protein
LANATTEDYQDAPVAIFPYRDQDISLFDVVLAAMSDRLKAPVRTFDHHFDVMKVKVWRRTFPKAARTCSFPVGGHAPRAQDERGSLER